MDAGRVEFLFVVRHAVVGLMQRLLETLELQGVQLVLAGLLDRFELIARVHVIRP